MKTVNMHEAKTHLSRLVQGAMEGEPFIIARSGKPAVKVMPVEEPPKKLRKLGFMMDQAHKWNIPDDFFDPAVEAEIEELSYAEKPLPKPVMTEALHPLADAKKTPAKKKTARKAAK
jgi:prevent-host-death family protein